MIIIERCKIGSHREGVVLRAGNIQCPYTLISTEQIRCGGIDVANDVYRAGDQRILPRGCIGNRQNLRRMT